jgi:hypothetical protein
MVLYPPIIAQRLSPVACLLPRGGVRAKVVCPSYRLHQGAWEWFDPMNFSKPTLIDFNVEFKTWPPSLTAIDTLE